MMNQDETDESGGVLCDTLEKGVHHVVHFIVLLNNLCKREVYRRKHVQVKIMQIAY